MASKELKEKKYIGRLIELAQDRRYSSAIDLWAAILMVGKKYKYEGLNGEEIYGVTAKDLAKMLEMKKGSIYHNLKILQSDEFQFLKTTNFIEKSKTAGRKVTQIVYSVPKDYHIELNELLDIQSKDGQYKDTHREITYFNFLKLRGILSLFASMIHEDRLLVKNKTEVDGDWYEKWMAPVKFGDQISSSGIVYTIDAKKMEKVLDTINECCIPSTKKELTEEEKEEKKKKKGTYVHFSYIVFPSETDEMKSGEWVIRKEFEKRMNKIPLESKVKETKECEKDHPTLFKYGLECPVCGKKPNST